jgi:peptidoglycan/LPS O-acetylase OafA/YrhL
LEDIEMIETKTTLRGGIAPGVGAATYNYPIGYLRAALVVLVVAHHTVLAYNPFAPPPPASLVAQPRWWQAFPVVDAQKWSGASPFGGFNDAFFMSLMFFVSGLFVWHGLVRKGGARYFRDRLRRLGLPFVIAAAVFAPLAYYPTYLQMANHTGPDGFWHQWLALGQWPAGPAWFIWVLLAFDCIAALLFGVSRSWGDTLSRLISRIASRQLVFFGAIVAISAVAYLPMALIFTPGAWTAVGPFSFQTSRIVHYLAYFLIAVGVGAWGMDRGVLASDGILARRWIVWVSASLVLFAIAAAVTVVALTSHSQSLGWGAAMDAGFVFSCAATGMAFLAVFLRFVKSRVGLFESVNANSYAIYLMHYPCVSWLQYALLPAALPGFCKAVLVFLGALGMSWILAASARRVPAVARVI